MIDGTYKMNIKKDEDEMMRLIRTLTDQELTKLESYIIELKNYRKKHSHDTDREE